MERGEPLAATASPVCAAWNAVFCWFFFFFDGLIVVRDRTAWRRGYRLPRQGRGMATRAEGFSTCVKVEARLGHKTAPL